MKGLVHRTFIGALIIATLACASSEARAQGYIIDAFSPRIYVGAQLSYNHILNGSIFFAESIDTTDHPSTNLTRPGLGWSLYIGLRFSPWLAAEIAWDALYHNSAEDAHYRYAMIDGVRGALKIHFPTGYNIEPFIRLGVGYYFYGDQFEADESGVGYSAGLGVNYQLIDALELELLVLYRAWYFRGIEWPSEGDHRCDGGGYCPFGDQYVHSVNVAVAFHWNAWLFGW